MSNQPPTELWYDRLLSQWLGGVAAILLFAMMVLTIVDVVSRYFFNAPILGATELTQIMLASLVFAGLPSVTARNEHVTIDLLDHLIPNNVHRLLGICAHWLSATILAAMAYVVIQHAGKTASSKLQTEILEIPMAPFAYFFGAMCGVASLILVLKVLRVTFPRRSNSKDV